jgi:hypothetical protein
MTRPIVVVMNKLSLFLIPILLAVSFGGAVAQAPQPILVDELGLHPCEDFASRVDHWIGESQRKPDMVPYAIVTGPAKDLLQRITYREWIKGQIEWRFEDMALRERFRILEGSLTEKPRIEFWLGSKDDPTLPAREKRWDLSLSVTKLRPYYQSQGDGGICPHIDHASIFKQLIQANPGLNGRVVFHEKDGTKFLEAKQDFLGVKPDVAPNRFSFVRPRKTDNFYDRHVEYWFVPVRR